MIGQRTEQEVNVVHSGRMGEEIQYVTALCNVMCIWLVWCA